MKKLTMSLMLCGFMGTSVAFARDISIEVFPAQPQLKLENGSVDMGNGMERILVAPWFGAVFTIRNSQNRDLVITHIQLDVTASDGQKVSMPGTNMAPTVFPPDSMAQVMGYADFLPKGEGLTYHVVARLKGWLGTKDKIEADIERTVEFDLK